MNRSDNVFRITPRLIVGLGILSFGLLWTLDNLDILEARPIMRWWPVVLVLIGLVKLFDPRSNKAAGVIFLVIGAALLVRRVYWFDIDFSDLIPLAIALLGAKLVWDAVARRQRPAGVPGEPDSELHAFAIMGGVKRQSIASDFRGADASAIMGGVELDLRSAQIQDGQEAIVDAFALWGGVEIFIPQHWRVISDVFPLMGAFEDKTLQTVAPNAPALRVRGSAVMGGIEVKN